MHEKPTKIDGARWRDRTVDIRLVRAADPNKINALGSRKRIESARSGVPRSTSGAHDPRPSFALPDRIHPIRRPPAQAAKAMRLPNIEYALDQGYELMVTKLINDRFQARIWLGTTSSSHNCLGKTIPEALEGLERFLTTVGLTAP